jgi:hypothetical protein
MVDGSLLLTKINYKANIMKRFINIIFSLLNKSVKKKQEVIIYEIHEYRAFINSITDLHILQSLFNASNNQKDSSFYWIKSWSSTALHYKSDFTDKIISDHYRKIENNNNKSLKIIIINP